MAKRKPEQPQQSKQPIQTKRRIARFQRDEKEKQKATYILGAVLALVVIVLLGGLTYTFLIEPNREVAQIGETTITLQDYQNRVRYERYLLDEQMLLLQSQFQQFMPSLGDQPELKSQFEQQFQYQLSQLQSMRLSTDISALDSLIEEEIIIRESAQREITVSDEEITQAYNGIAVARKGGYTESQAEETVTARKNATATAEQFPPTPTITGTEILTPTPILPTPTINTLEGESLDEALTEWENTMRENTSMTPADLRKIVSRQLMRNKLSDSMGEEIDTTKLQAHARHILVDTEDEVFTVTQRLANGDDFASVAMEFSKDPGSAQDGGDLGWFTKGTMVEEFDNVAFSLPVGEISEPVQSEFGFHIIEVIAREERPLEGSDLDREKINIFNNWLLEESAHAVKSWDPRDAPPEATPSFPQSQ
ncbi:MAG: hypothetical protein B6242_02800 [Anaerolineaceae bacterium 4572_78]|nr:MAG: hypothetical protein B6242_02800 [Anaerolineaceae bacterium 4572_78]